jgi:hypothetical protein
LEDHDFARRVALDEVAEELEGVAASEESGGVAPSLPEERRDGKHPHWNANQLETTSTDSARR